MKKDLFKGLKGKILIGTLTLSCLMLTIVLSTGVYGITNFVMVHMRGEVERQCDLIEDMLSSGHDEPYEIKIEADGAIQLYKGKRNVRDSYKVIENMCQIMQTDVSFFVQDTRLISTVKDKAGNSAVGSVASPVVVRDVLKTGQDRFYTDAEIFGDRNYVYYRPIFDKDNAVIGMIGISKSPEFISTDAKRAVIPVLICSVFAILCGGFISASFAKSLLAKINIIENFMEKVTDGNFSESMDSKLVLEKDEIGDLARIGVLMQKSLRVLVEKDTLTQLNNRRCAMGRLEQIRNKAEVNGIRYSICICDIDHFKHVNDTYGHESGDDVLKVVSKILRESMVGKGFAARWGGEEFLLVFENGTFEDHVQTLKNTLQQIGETQVETAGQTICVTMTMGIIEANLEESDDVLLSKADSRLYYGKTHGRNQVVAEDMEETE